LGYWDYVMCRAIVVAASGVDPRSVAGSVRAAIRRADPDVPIAAMRTMREVLAESVAQRRFQMLLVGAFALCAVFLAGLGIYGVVAYAVARRTKELGIRAAFGARSSDLYAIVLRQGLKPVALGLVLGLCGALAAGRALQSLLYEVRSDDPAVFAAVAIAVLVVALAACGLPARRAARIEPMTALRCE